MLQVNLQRKIHSIIPHLYRADRHLSRVVGESRNSSYWKIQKCSHLEPSTRTRNQINRIFAKRRDDHDKRSALDESQKIPLEINGSGLTKWLVVWDIKII